MYRWDWLLGGRLDYNVPQVKHVQDIIIRMGNVCFLKGHQQSFIMGY